MFGHRSFLLLDSESGANILSLIKGGYEISDFNFSFQQGIDDKGKATTKVHGGVINITLSQLPPQPIIEWGMQPKKYLDGIIVILDAENIPLEKIFFKKAACVDFEVSYTQSDESYSETHIIIQAKQLIVGEGIEFENGWTE